MVQTLTIGQIAQLSGKLPVLSPPSVLTTPYVASDVWVGDNLDINPSATTSGFPVASPAYTLTAKVNGVSKGDATTYTIQAGDAGQSLVVTQAASNIQGMSSRDSATITPIVAPTNGGVSLLGGNIGSPAESSVLQFLNNAGQAGRLPFYIAGTSFASAYTGGFDANGWPTSAFAYLIAATAGGRDGQLPAGTYKCSYRSTGQATTVTAAQSCTVSGLQNTHPTTGINDGVTRYFTLTIPFAVNPGLTFDGGIQYLDIPRDGVTYTYGGPEFWSTNLAFFAQMGCLRLMDLCQSNIGEKLWSDRIANRPEYGPTQPATSYSWERIARFIKAVVQYSGSRVQQVMINPPGLLDPTVANANNYAYQLPTLLNTILSGVTVSLDIELGDEPWNPSLGTAPVYTGNINTAISETQCLQYYPGISSVISSVVGNGDGTVTVTTTQPVASITLPGGGSFSITNGQQMIADFQQNTYDIWRAGSVSPNSSGNYATDGTVTSVPITVLTSTSFKYTSKGSPSGTLPATSGSTQAGFFFGLTSNLVKDGTSMNLYDIGNKVHVRRTYQAQQIWKTIRPQDRFVLNLQQYGSGSPAAMTGSKPTYPYSRYIGGGDDTWCYGTMVAPYVKPDSAPFGVATAGGTTITGVSWAPYAQPGDQITVSGAGTSGGNLSTTVVSGSGTTLTVSNTIVTTSNNGVIGYVTPANTSVTASVDGGTGVMTVTAGSGLLVGMMVNGTPSTMAFNTRITSQLTGTTGGVGTYQLNIAQAVSSQTITFAQTDGLVNAMIASVPGFARTLAGHIYTASRWGKRAMCYEAGPDTQSFANYQVAIGTNPYMQTLNTKLLDAWFNQGGQEFFYYNWAPIVLVNASYGEWQALQSYSDTSAPKHAALANYATVVPAYANNFGSPGSYGPAGSSGSYTENPDLQAAAGWQGFYTPAGMLGCAGNANDRYVEVLFCFPRGRRWAITVSGTDSVTGTQGDVYIDGVYGSTPVGTVTLPNNGTGASGSTTPGNSTTLQLGEISRGTHRIKVDFPAGRGQNVGVFGITLSKY